MKHILLILIASSLLVSCRLTGTQSSVDDVTSPVQTDAALAIQVMPKLNTLMSADGKKLLATAESQALELGRDNKVFKWPETLNGSAESGTVTASSPFKVGQSVCRRFEHKISIRGASETAVGTACKKGSGVWMLVR